IKCVNSYSNFTLRQKIKNFNKDGNIIFFLDNIEALALDNEILNNRFALIASILFELQYEFKDPDSSVFYNTSATEYSERILSKIVACIDKENDRYEIISSAVKNINRDNVGTTSTIIR
ncbi:ATPase, partial [Bifidobacteriaceae bacterium WP022]